MESGKILAFGAHDYMGSASSVYSCGFNAIESGELVRVHRELARYLECGTVTARGRFETHGSSGATSEAFPIPSGAWRDAEEARRIDWHKSELAIPAGKYIDVRIDGDAIEKLRDTISAPSAAGQAIDVNSPVPQKERPTAAQLHDIIHNLYPDGKMPGITKAEKDIREAVGNAKHKPVRATELRSFLDRDEYKSMRATPGRPLKTT